MTVVVGVDGSPKSHAAMRLAFAEARYRGSQLIAVMAYGGDGAGAAAPAARPVSTLSTATEQRQITEVTLRQVVRDALGEQAAEVELRAVQGFPGHALVEVAQSAHAQMVVLAARRGDGAVARLLGTVSQYVLRHAPCPVLVVPIGS